MTRAGLDKIERIGTMDYSRFTDRELVDEVNSMRDALSSAKRRGAPINPRAREVLAEMVAAARQRGIGYVDAR